jgi:orotidine-5'-phosphate decarboxylase
MRGRPLACLLVALLVSVRPGDAQTAASKPASAKPAGTVRINGSSTVLPLAREAVRSFQASGQNRGSRFELGASGTSAGFRQFCAGRLSIATASRPISGAELAQCEARGVRFIELPVAFDAITVAPYMGKDSVDPFLAYTNKWTIVLGLTSNTGSQNFEQQKLANGQFLYESVLEQVASWGTEEQLMFVVGATKAEDFTSIRKIIPNHFLLVPGVGAQGGSLSEVTKYGKNESVGLLVNASRAVIFASGGVDFAEKAAIAAKEYATEMKSLLSI